MRTKALSILVVATIVAVTLPAQADRLVSSSSRECGDSLCAEAWAYGTIDCDQVADDTVSCEGSIRLHARVNYTGWPYLRFPGEATWRNRMSCGWFVVGGSDDNCGWQDVAQTSAWEMNDLGDENFIAERSFGPVSHTSDEPFCLFMYLDGSSSVRATSTLFGLADHETVETAAGFFEEGDIACASGGEPPG